MDEFKFNKWFYVLIVLLVAIVLMQIFVTFAPKAGAHSKCYENCYISPVPEVTVEPTLEPSVTPEATPSPTQAPVRTDLSDGKSDGKSDGLSSCPSCTQAPKDNYPKSNFDNANVGWK